MHFWARFGEVGRIWMPPQFWHIGGSMAQLHLLRCSEVSKTVLHRKWSSPSLVKKNGWWVFVQHPYSRSSVSTADFLDSQMDWNRLTAILPDHLSWVPYLDLQGSTRNPRPTTSVLSVTWRIWNYTSLRVATGSRTWFVNLPCLWIWGNPGYFLGEDLQCKPFPCVVGLGCLGRYDGGSKTSQPQGLSFCGCSENGDVCDIVFFFGGVCCLQSRAKWYHGGHPAGFRTLNKHQDTMKTCQSRRVLDSCDFLWFWALAFLKCRGSACKKCLAQSVRT